MVSGRLFLRESASRIDRLRGLIWINPFSPERATLEAELGGFEAAVEEARGFVVAARPALGRNQAALAALGAAPEDGTEDLQLPNGALSPEGSRSSLSALTRSPSSSGSVPLALADRDRYEELVSLVWFADLMPSLDAEIERLRAREAPRRLGSYRQLATGLAEQLPYGFQGSLAPLPTERLYAVFWQLRRAFLNIHAFIVGRSKPAEKLRARIWQSIFTHNLRRYQRSLAGKMQGISTLITGPSGSGKELVAQGIGWSGFIPFDPLSGHFRSAFPSVFAPVNLSALSAQLIESELFGHRKGAFTGALQDREGYLAASGPDGAVLLDEIGEADLSIQVKLLRVLQTRQFTPIGTTELLPFQGKVIAATNRDLDREMADGTFREDLYFRLNADRIVTPALREILAEGAPGELATLVQFIAMKLAGDAAEEVTEEATRFIEQHLPADYAWPGNFRELEQCVRNVMVHGDYRPTAPRLPVTPTFNGLPESRRASPTENLSSEALAHWQHYRDGGFTVDALLTDYLTRLHRKTPNWAQLSAQVGKDRRTIQRYVEGLQR